jgi:chromosome segregation ATPase
MRYVAAIVLLAGFGVRAGLGQTVPASEPARTTQADSATLDAILAEIRGIHNDVRLSETTQILLTEMEVQRGAVDKALEKRDSARNRVSQLQVNEKQFATQIASLEESAKSTLDPVMGKRISDQADNMKATMENFKNQEPDAASALQDAETALRKEQDTLAGIQDQLNDVVKKLQPVGK